MVIDDRTVIAAAEVLFMALQEQSTKPWEYRGRAGALVPAVNLAQVLREQGFELDRNERRQVYEYLRERRNVVTLGKSAKGSRTYDVFVANVWSQEVAQDEDRWVSFATKRHAEEQALKAGELAGEVESKSISVLTEFQWTLLRSLQSMGGKVSDSSGHATRLLLQHAGLYEYHVDNGYTLTSTLKSLDDRGYINRELNAKRTKSISLTKEGRYVLKHPSTYRSATALLAEYLMKVGSFTGSVPSNTTNELAQAIGSTPHRVSDALRSLSDRGLIDAIYSEGGGVYKSVRWLNKPYEIETMLPIELPKAEPPGEAAEHIVSTEPTEQEESKVSDNLEYYLDEAINLIETAKKKQFYVDPYTEVRSIIKQFSNGEISALKALSLIDEEVSQ